MGALAYKSRFLPRFIGVWLIINGVAYIVLSLTGLFFPDYQNKVFAYSQPALFGELAIMLWLVLKGASPGLQPRLRSEERRVGKESRARWAVQCEEEMTGRVTSE